VSTGQEQVVGLCLGLQPTVDVPPPPEAKKKFQRPKCFIWTGFSGGTRRDRPFLRSFVLRRSIANTLHGDAPSSGCRSWLASLVDRHMRLRGARYVCRLCGSTRR
jgi:hypothetical protein